MAPSHISLWPPSFEAAIFDFDGTIAETASIWNRVDEVFLGSRGIEYTEEYARILSVLGFDRGAQYTIDTYHLDDTPEEVVAEWTRLSSALYRSEVELKPGVRDYLLSLRRRGIPCVLATSNERALIEGMQHVNVFALFDACVYGGEVGVPKNEPDIYLEAARLVGVDPSRCLVFEDLEPAIEAARRGGFATCAVKADDKSQRWELLSALANISLTSWVDVGLLACSDEGTR